VCLLIQHLLFPKPVGHHRLLVLHAHVLASLLHRRQCGRGLRRVTLHRSHHRPVTDAALAAALAGLRLPHRQSLLALGGFHLRLRSHSHLPIGFHRTSVM